MANPFHNMKNRLIASPGQGLDDAATNSTDARSVHIDADQRRVSSRPFNPRAVGLYVRPLDRGPSYPVGNLFLRGLSRVAPECMIECFAIDGLRMLGQPFTDRLGKIGIVSVRHVTKYKAALPVSLTEIKPRILAGAGFR
jgi:hypothetical protein